MNDSADFLLFQTEREKHLRFEKLSETFSYITIVGGIILSFLPYEFPFDRTRLYIAVVVIAFLIFAWFRLIPKKYSGAKKNFVYAFMAVCFIAVAVHFTRGVQSVTVFLFYLTSIGAAASMSVKQVAAITIVSALFIWIEAILGLSEPELGVMSLSMGVLHIWGLVLTTSYAWLVFQEETAAKAREEKAKIEKVEAVDQVKNEFVFIISNKLREPIASLSQYLKTAGNIKDKITPEQTDLLNKTKENSDRLSELVEDLSDLTKIETGRIRLELKTIDLNQVIGATLSDFTFPAHEKNISLSYDPPKEDILVKADSGRLHEIIANLIDNAIKYSPKNKKITVSISKTGKFAETRVKDEGFGIPDEQKKHLFEKFFRVDRPGQMEAKGTGLGLFITKQLVERQGGTITFESKEGKGTEFIFNIPLVGNE